MRSSLLTLVATALVALLVAPVAHAKKGPCVVGQKAPKCLVWDAKVKFAADGDTFRPKVKKGKRYGKKVTVRMTGIQAPELKSYSRAKGRKGNCLGVEATEELEKFIKRKKIRLVAMKAGSTTEGNRSRLRRTVQVKSGGKWVDPAMTLLEKGLVLWFPNRTEFAWNRVYSELAEQAAARGVGLWNPNACGKPGPSQNSPLSLKVKWDGIGTDTPNSEWVRIKNGDPVNDVSLRGWTLRDSHLRGRKLESGYRFPSNAVVPAGGSLMVFVGPGSAGDNSLHWGLNEIIFDNATDDKRQLGDGAYLFDPDSELRAWVQYPCRTTCPEPLAGKVEVNARYEGASHEWIHVKNVSGETISLNEYELENVPWFYEFGPNDVLAPGKAATVWVTEPHPVPVDTPIGPRVEVRPVPGVGIPGLRDFEDSAYFRSWNQPKAILNDGGDVVVLRNPNGAPVPGACHQWGRFRCPSV